MSNKMPKKEYGFRPEIEQRLSVRPEDILEAIEQAPPFLMSFLYARAKEEIDDTSPERPLSVYETPEAEA